MGRLTFWRLALPGMVGMAIFVPAVAIVEGASIEISLAVGIPVIIGVAVPAAAPEIHAEP